MLFCKLQAVTEIPAVRQRWFEQYGRLPNQGDVDNMFKDFVPMQLDCLRLYTGLIPGCAESVNTLKTEFKLKIGSTTGFLKSMVDVLLEEAKKQGYSPDCAVAGDEVIHGARPKPFMVYRNMDILDVHPIQSVVKVDDTVSGVGEALEAGCWGVGVARYSNYMDVDNLEHETQISEEDMEVRAEISREILRKSGAHYVIDSIAELPEVVANINERLARGEKP